MAAEGIYTPTDVNELRSIIEERRLNSAEFVRDYDKGWCIVRVNGTYMKAVNLPPYAGEQVRADRSLSFDPRSVILGPITRKNSKSIKSKLFDEGVLHHQVKE